jgi:hypothetical protein
MANTFNARFDLIAASLSGINTWTIVGNVVDNGGNFSSMDARVGDIIYNDGAMMGLGVLRYRVLSIISVDSSTITVTAIWALPEASQEPISGSSGCIGTPNEQDVVAIIDPGQQATDAVFITAVRNMETILLSQKIIPTTDVMMKTVYDKDADSKIDPAAIPDLDLGQF